LSNINGRAIWLCAGDLNIDGGTYRATGAQIGHALYIFPEAGLTTNTVLNNVTLESFASADGVGGGGLFVEISQGGGVANNVTVTGGRISNVGGAGLPTVSMTGSGALAFGNCQTSCRLNR
jgi:hypothetical protein